MNPHQCPFCQHTIEPIPEAKEGDFILCGCCQSALRYMPDLLLREMTVDEAIEFPHIAHLFGVRRREVAAERPAQ